MQASSIKTTTVTSLIIFLGLVSRDLNAHHQVVALHNEPQEPRTFSSLMTDIFYAEPTLTIRKPK